MGEPVKIPVRVVQRRTPDIAPARPVRREMDHRSAAPGFEEREDRSTVHGDPQAPEVHGSVPHRSDGSGITERAGADQDLQQERSAKSTKSFQDRPSSSSIGRSEAEDWRGHALRLQAEMENYRKRQRRLAEEQIEIEQDRLLEAFSKVIDDLERALQASSSHGQGLQQGVQIIHDEAIKLLGREGVEKIEAQDRPFDPNWHEAMMTVPSRDLGVPPNTVVRVVEPGYRRDGRLLKPARVVVGV